MSRVTMDIKEEGLPLHNDLTLKVRSRLFLEGNYFVELRPGTPNAPELELGRGDRPRPHRRAGPARTRC